MKLQLGLILFWEVCFDKVGGHFEARFILSILCGSYIGTWNSKKEEKETSLLTYHAGPALKGAPA